MPPGEPLFLAAGADSVLIADGTILAIGGELEVPPDARVLDCRGARICGGAVNAHTHLYSGLAPLGMPAPSPPPESFVQILERLWWRLDRALDESSLRASAELYVAESLLFGTTTLIDHHESPCFIAGSLDVLADAAQTLGCRLATGYGATDRNGGPEEGQRGLEECRRFAADNQRPLVRPLVALHASFTVSDATVREAAALAAKLDLPMHVHVAEDQADVEDAQTRGYSGPLERLLEQGALPRGSVIAHGVHLDERAVKAADAAGLWFVHNPRSNAGNRVGFARHLGASTHVALGTDGYPADMRREREALAEEAARAGSPLSEAEQRARAMAGHSLAAALFGVSISPEPSVGAQADLAVWPDGAAWSTPNGRPLHVVVAGEVVVESGRLTRGELDAIRAAAEREAPRLWERMRGLGG